MNPTSSPPTDDRRLIDVPTASIDNAGLNPREIDLESESFLELRRSIEGRGILQPLLVRTGETDLGVPRYEVVAGHRRLAAAKSIGLAKVPALVIDLDDRDATIAAVTENVQRQNMTPLEEARAVRHLRETMNLRPADVADLLGKSPTWARNRERLLEMPEVVVNAIDNGTVPLEATIHLQRISETAPAAAELLVEPVVNNETGEILDTEPLTTEERVASRLLEISRENPDAALIRVNMTYNTGIRLDDVPLTRVQRARIDHVIADTEVGNTLQFVESDILAARAYGALLEVGRFSWVTDMEWLTDRLVVIAEREVKALADAAAERAATAADEPDDDAELRRREQAERKAEAKRIAEEKRAADVHLLDNLEGMASPTITVDLARAIAAGVLGAFEPWDLERIYRGDDRYATDPTGVIIRRLEEATQPGEVLAVVLPLLVADVCGLEGLGNSMPLTEETRPEFFVEKWAMDSGLLTQPHRDKIDTRWRELTETANPEGSPGTDESDTEAVTD